MLSTLRSSRTTYYYQRLLQVAYIHIHLSLFTLPIILFWEFPFSPWSLVGNVIFAPFLSLFLLGASLLFITEVLYIPNEWAAYFLNGITILWKSALCLTPSAPWAGSSPSLILMCIAAATGAFIIHTRHTTLQERLLYLLVLTASIWAYIYFFCQPNMVIRKYSPTLACISTSKTIFCIDKGTITRNPQKIATWFKRAPPYPKSSQHVLICLKPTPCVIHIAQLFLKDAHKAYIILPHSTYGKESTLTQTLDKLAAWSKKHAYTMIYVKDDTLLDLEGVQLSLKVKGCLPRTCHNQQTLFSLQSTLFPQQLIFPALTRREQELLRRQSKLEEDT